VEKKQRVLFLSVHNSVRGQMAEGDLRAMARFIATRGGIEAGEGIDSVAAEITAESDIDITSQHPKNVSEWFKEHFAYVNTLADSARERSPVFPFTPHLLHWNLRDPTLVRVPRKRGNRPFAIPRRASRKYRQVFGGGQRQSLTSRGTHTFGCRARVRMSLKGVYAPSTGF
jgi:protein-tyrosine-phosphatase